MPYKLCPNCNQSSYSASERGVWNCPHCGQNMTFVASAGEAPEPVPDSRTWKMQKKVQFRTER